MAHAARPEQAHVDAARPRQDVAEATLGQRLSQAARRHHRAGPGIVKAAQQRVRPGSRHREPALEIFRELGVKARGERQAAAPAIRTRHQANRPLCRNVDRIGLDAVDETRATVSVRHGQRDLRIRRTRHRAKSIRRQKLDSGTDARQLLRQLLVGAHHAIDLRPPGIRGDQDAHHAATSCGDGASASMRRRTSSCQCTSCISPSIVSRMAVQLSTQSPVLR